MAGKKLAKGVTTGSTTGSSWVEVKLQDGTTVKVTQPSHPLTVPPAPNGPVDPNAKPARKPDEKRKNQGNGPIQEFPMNGGEPKRRRMKVGANPTFSLYEDGIPNVVATGYYQGLGDPEALGPVADQQVKVGVSEPLPSDRIRSAFWDDNSKMCLNTAFWL